MIKVAQAQRVRLRATCFFMGESPTLLYSGACKTYESVLNTVRRVPYVEDMGSPLIWPFVLQCTTRAWRLYTVDTTDPTLGLPSCAGTLRSITSRLGLLVLVDQLRERLLAVRAKYCHISCSRPDYPLKTSSRKRDYNRT